MSKTGKLVYFPQQPQLISDSARSAPLQLVFPPIRILFCIRTHESDLGRGQNLRSSLNSLAEQRHFPDEQKLAGGHQATGSDQLLGLVYQEVVNSAGVPNPKGPPRSSWRVTHTRMHYCIIGRLRGADMATLVGVCQQTLARRQPERFYEMILRIDCLTVRLQEAPSPA